MERKFKVGDKVRINTISIDGKIVFVDESKPDVVFYLIVYNYGSGNISTWIPESNLTLIEPEYNYKEGDEVWHKTENRKYLFSCYMFDDGCRLSLGATTYTRLLSEIEPYTGQDKQFKPSEIAEKIIENDPKKYFKKEADAWYEKVLSKSRPTHPYTVILKSGVKVGLSDERAKAIIKHRHLLQEEDLYDSQLAVLQLDEKFDFTNMEISAIVPTENIL